MKFNIKNMKKSISIYLSIFYFNLVELNGSKLQLKKITFYQIYKYGFEYLKKNYNIKYY